MGYIYQPTCESCHHPYKTLFLGVGMRDMEKETKTRICYECEEIKEIDTPNRTKRCRRCKSDLLILGESDFDTDSPIECPKCKKPSLHFMFSGLWD